jgi:hypothetical protein
MKTELHNKIERIILTAINRIPSSRPFEVYGDVFALPEDLDIDQLAVNPSSLRLAVNTNISPEDGYTASGYGVLIRSNKPYATFTFRERGLATSVCVPWPTEPGTTECISVPLLPSYVGSCKNYTTVEEMGGHISQLRRGYTLREPEKTTNCRVSVDRKFWDCAHTGGTGSFGRPVATINTMLKGFGLPQLDTLAGNDMLAKVAAAVNDERAVVSWLEAPISELYSNESSSYQRFTSCMKGESPETFEIYDELQEAGRLRMLLVHKASRPESGTHIGRALVWVGANPDDSYIDRIYCESAANSSDPNPMVAQAISDFCKAEGIGKTVYEQTARVIPFLTHTTLRVKSNFYFDRYPYVDSLRYLYDDGWLSTSSSRGYDCRILNQTDGMYEGQGQDDEDDLILCACGSYYPEDETRYSNSRGETYHNDDVSWVSTSDGFIPDDDIVSINGTDYDRERDDVVELHDGDYALHDDAIELHDGDYALIEDAVLLHDGAYALERDAVELPDGYFVLRVDAHENEDGTWSVNP